MTEFRKPADAAVPWYASKYDEFKFKDTGKPYKLQKGSGRAEVLALVKDGMLVGTWTKKCAEKGFDPRFAINAMIKHRGPHEKPLENAKWDANPPSGKTWEMVKKEREERILTPEQKAAKEAKEAARKEAKAAKEAEKEAKRVAAAKENMEKKAAKAAEAKGAKGTTAPAPAPAPEAKTKGRKKAA